MRTRLETVASFRVGCLELEEVRAAAYMYQELLRLGCPLENDGQALDEPEPRVTLHDAIAALQPVSHSSPFTSLAPSTAALAATSAQAVLRYDVPPHGSASNEELFAKLQHLAHDNLQGKIVRASAAMFPHKGTSVFYS